MPVGTSGCTYPCTAFLRREPSTRGYGGCCPPVGLGVMRLGAQQLRDVGPLGVAGDK